MNWVNFFTGMCGMYAIAGAWAGITSAQLMRSQYLRRGEKTLAAIIFMSWLMAVGFMAWRIFT
jgi:hypothetical protein